MLNKAQFICFQMRFQVAIPFCRSNRSKDMKVQTFGQFFSYRALFIASGYPPFKESTENALGGKTYSILFSELVQQIIKCHRIQVSVLKNPVLPVMGDHLWGDDGD